MAKVTVRQVIQIAALLLLLLGGLLLDLLLQSRPAAELIVGGRDLGYVEGFSAKEWSDALPGPSGPEAASYRWMGADGSLRLGPVRAGQALLLRLRMARPVGPAWPEVRLLVQGQLWVAFPLAPTLQDYALMVPAGALEGRDLVVKLHVDTFQVKGDTRDLGLIVEQAQVEVLAGGPGAALGQYLAGLRPVYGLAVPAAALAALALGVAFWPAWGLGAGFLVLIAGGALLRPEATTRVGSTLAVLLVISAVVAGTLRLLAPRVRAWARWLGDHATVVLLLLFLVTLLAAFFPHIEADGIEYYAYLRSLAFDGDLHFANELSLDTPFPHVPYGLGGKKTPTGYEPNFASVGPAIVWTPFFAVGHLLALGGHALGLPWTVDGYSEPYVVLICFGSTLSALVTLLLGYDLVRRLYDRSVGLLTVVSTFFGTTLFYYAFYKPDFAHALATCGVTVFVYLWVRTLGRRTVWQWLWLGLAAGFMTTLYWIDAIFVVVVALEMLWEAVRIITTKDTGGAKDRQQGRSATTPPSLSPGGPSSARWRALGALVLGGAIFALAFLLAVSPQMVAWKIIFGQWLTQPQEGFAAPAGFLPLQLFLSPLHGLLPWTPLAVLGMVGLLLLAWEKRPWGMFALVGLALYFLYNATLSSWHGGGYFGLRRLTNAFPFFLLGMAALLQRVRRWRAEGAVLTALLPTFWSLMVLLRYLVYVIPHYPLELEGLSLSEFLFAPGNMPIDRLPEALRLSFFVQWAVRLAERFRPADLGYGIILVILFVAAAWGVWRGMGRWLRDWVAR